MSESLNFIHTNEELITKAIHALTCCEKEVEVNSEMINMSASMPMLPFSFASKATVERTSISEITTIDTTSLIERFD